MHRYFTVAAGAVVAGVEGAEGVAPPVEPPAAGVAGAGGARGVAPALTPSAFGAR